LPPPPRTAQNRSAFSSALAVTKLPSPHHISHPVIVITRPVLALGLAMAAAKSQPRLRPLSSTRSRTGTVNIKALRRRDTPPCRPQRATVLLDGSTRTRESADQSTTRRRACRSGAVVPPPRTATVSDCRAQKIDGRWITSAASVAARDERQDVLSIIALLDLCAPLVSGVTGLNQLAAQ